MLNREAFIDISSAFEMVSSAIYDRLPTRPSINSYKKSVPDIFKVGGESAVVRGYNDVPLQITGIEIATLLLIDTNSPFTLLIEINILRPHSARFSVCDASFIQLRNNVCAVCLEQRVDAKQEFLNALAVVCVFYANRLSISPPPSALSLPPSTLTFVVTVCADRSAVVSVDPCSLCAPSPLRPSTLTPFGTLFADPSAAVNAGPPSLSASTFVQTAVSIFEAPSSSVFDPMPVMIIDALPASLTVPPSVTPRAAIGFSYRVAVPLAVYADFFAAVSVERADTRILTHFPTNALTLISVNYEK